jgi:regulatory protein
MEEKVRARKRALYLLTDMDRTESELLEKLKKTGYSDETVADAMEYVKSFGYLDDRKYAAKYLEVYLRKRSLQRVRFDMSRKGLAKEVIDAAIDEIEPYDERPLIRSLAEKKMHSLKDTDEKKAAKVGAALQRQGFRPADIRSVMEDMGLYGMG